MCITVIYIHTCVGLKHYDKFFKYPNSLFYNEVYMISIRLLHPHNPLIFVASANFSCACTRPHPSHPPSAFSSSIAQIRLFTLGCSPTVCVGPQLLLYGTHRSICLSSQVCLAQTQASPLLLSPSMPHSHHSFHRSRTRTLLPPRYSMPLVPPPTCIPLSLSFSSCLICF